MANYHSYNKAYMGVLKILRQNPQELPFMNPIRPWVLEAPGVEKHAFQIGGWGGGCFKVARRNPARRIPTNKFSCITPLLGS